MATSPLFTVAFDVKSSDDRLGNPEHFYRDDSRVLPPAPPGRWFHVVLRTPTSTLTLAARDDSLCMEGFRSSDGTWWELAPGLIPSGATNAGFGRRTGRGQARRCGARPAADDACRERARRVHQVRHILRREAAAGEGRGGAAAAPQGGRGCVVLHRHIRCQERRQLRQLHRRHPQPARQPEALLRQLPRRPASGARRRPAAPLVLRRAQDADQRAHARRPCRRPLTGGLLEQRRHVVGAHPGPHPRRHLRGVRRLVQQSRRRDGRDARRGARPAADDGGRERARRARQGRPGMQTKQKQAGRMLAALLLMVNEATRFVMLEIRP